MASRRKHSKVEGLPPEIVAAVNEKLTEHHTYDEIAAWLKQLGHGVSKSSIGRYGKDFLTRLERLRVVRDQARAIVETDPDAPATEMAEAANQLALQMIMELLMKLPEDALQEAKLTEVLKALANLERSAVAREKLKYEFHRGVDAAVAAVKAELKKEMARRPDLMEQMYALVEQAAQRAKI